MQSNRDRYKITSPVRLYTRIKGGNETEDRKLGINKNKWLEKKRDSERLMKGTCKIISIEQRVMIDFN